MFVVLADDSYYSLDGLVVDWAVKSSDRYVLVANDVARESYLDGLNEDHLEELIGRVVTVAEVPAWRKWNNSSGRAELAVVGPYESLVEALYFAPNNEFQDDTDDNRPCPDCGRVYCECYGPECEEYGCGCGCQGDFL